jgi:membrane complex biogenesis BtpA family protein
MSRFRELFPGDKTIIAVCHLPPLPDYPGSPGLDALRAHALADLAVLEAGGVDGILVENEYDRPHRVLAEAETVAAMTDITAAVAPAASNVRVGCEILLNDPKASLDVARATGARFIRSDYFVDRMMRPEYGELEIDPQGLIAYRSEIGAADVLILADIQVKFATMLEKRSLQESARLACLNKADALVVTGAATGDAPTVRQLLEARSGVDACGGGLPILVGSGLNPDNAAELLDVCDGAIVGTSLMENGRISAAALDRLMAEVRKATA